MASYDLCTLDEVRDYMGMTGSSSVVDDVLADLITRVTEGFHKDCGVTQFKATDHTEYYSGAGTIELFVINTPVNTIASIYEDSDWVYGEDTKIDEDTYAPLNNMVVLKDSVFNIGIRNIKITYNAGYNDIPGDLKQACIEETVRKFKKRENVDIISKSGADGSFTKIQHGKLKDTIEILKNYKSLGVY